jgi:hypothetical protein
LAIFFSGPSSNARVGEEDEEEKITLRWILVDWKSQLISIL